MATLKDIAAACGTSIATVSYVLSGRGEEKRISPAMRELVTSTAAQLNYKYTSKTKRSDSPRIAVYWPQKYLDMAIPSFFRGMNSSLTMATSPVDVSIRPFEQDFLSSQQALWGTGSFDAAIIASASLADLDVLSQRKTCIPTVLLSRTLPGYFSVTIDQHDAGRIAANHAIEYAGSDIALVIPSGNLYGTVTRGQAVCDTCLEHGIDLSENIIYCNNDIDDGYAVGQRMILEHKLHKAIICIYDMIAIGIMNALNDAGIKVGTDIDVISMSSSYDRPTARMYSNLTVVDLRHAEVSNKAMNIAIDIAMHKVSEPCEIVFHPRLIHSQSSLRTL